MEADILIATSDSGTGTLKAAKIKNADNQTVLEEDISGYYDTVDVSSLRPGTYTAYITTTLTTYTEGFTVN